jgi:hypothetical protein
MHDYTQVWNLTNLDDDVSMRSSKVLQLGGFNGALVFCVLAVLVSSRASWPWVDLGTEGMVERRHCMLWCR